MYAYTCVCTVFVLNSQSPNCCSFLSLTLDLSYCFSLYFLLMSAYLRGESFWWHSFPTGCPRHLMSPPRLGCAGHRGTAAAAAAAPAHAQRCRLVSTAVTRGWLQTQGWQVTGSASSVQGKGKKGGIQCVQTHTRGKRTHILTF